MPFVTINGRRIEYQKIDAATLGRPTLVFLHEGLGSIALWRDFPEKVAEATRCAVLVYSRYGYGGSTSLTAPRGVRYMHDEALEVLPALLQALDIGDPLLIGHSDGASIALIHAAARRWPVRGLVLEAPHVFVEDITVASIAEAKEAWRTTDLRRRLSRYHEDVDGAFQGWNDIWLHPDFRAWNIEAELPKIECPVMVIQGADDEYGTPAQLRSIEEKVRGPVELMLLERCKHSPHRDQPDSVLAAISRFVATYGTITSGASGSA
jgi:pimeloyl-ACP methyl ester carboxylesterase